MTLRIIEDDESNHFGGLFQRIARSLKQFKLNYEEIPLPIRRNECLDQLVLSAILSDELVYQEGGLTSLSAQPMQYYPTPVYQMNLPLEKPSGQQNTTVLQLLKPYMIQNTVTVKKD